MGAKEQAGPVADIVAAMQGGAGHPGTPLLWGGPAYGVLLPGALDWIRTRSALRPEAQAKPCTRTRTPAVHRSRKGTNG
jgi:hypothetical protein